MHEIKDLVACYVTDAGFLFPSIASAMSLRAKAGKHDCDVVIFAIGIAPDQILRLRDSLSSFRIDLIELESDLGIIDKSKWNGTHVPLATVGRFFVAEVLKHRYRRILYIDGDTMFARDPSELFHFDPGPGRIGAVEDIRSFARDDIFGATGKYTREYFKNIGVQKGQGYFNAGVFIVRSEDWVDMSRQCLEYLVKNTEICRFHDQSAMNAVLGKDGRSFLSLRWNFQTPYNLLWLYGKIDPALVHFTEANKPWLGAMRPWCDWHERYRAVELAVAGLQRPQAWPDAQVAAANRHYAERVFRQSAMFAHRLPGRWARIRHYEAECLI